MNTLSRTRHHDFIGQVHQQACDKHSRLINALTVTVYLTNDNAGFALFDAMQELRKSRLFQGKVRTYANRANKNFDNYQRFLRQSFGFADREKLYLDLADDFHDMYDRHVTMLRLAVSQVLTRLQLPDRETKSYVITAEYALEITTGIFSSGFKILQDKTGVDFQRYGRGYDLSPVLKMWREASSLLVPNNVMTLVDNDKQVCLAKEILCKRAADHNSLNDMATRTIEKNLDTLRKYNPEGYEWLMAKKKKKGGAA